VGSSWSESRRPSPPVGSPPFKLYVADDLSCGLLMRLRKQDVQSVCGRVQALARKK